jgi:hypothetical protein
VIIWSFGKCAHDESPENWRIEKEWTEWVCPCNISYGLQMKKMCLIVLLLGSNHGCITTHTNPNQSVLQCNGNIPVHLQPKSSEIKVTPSAWKVMFTVFWDSHGVLLAHFRGGVKMWILHRTMKFCWSFVMQFAENVQNGWQEVYCFIVTMSDSIQLEQPTRIWEVLEHPPYNPDLAPSDFHLFGQLKKLPWWQTFCWWRRG